jgi:hypothetical protein
MRHLLLAGIALAPMLVHAQPAPTAPAAERDVVKAVAQASLDTNDVDVSQNIEDKSTLTWTSRGCENGSCGTRLKF